MKLFCLEADVVSPSGRIYPRAVLEKAVEAYNEKHVKNNRAFGELGFPETQTVNLKDVSHIVRGFEWEGDKLFAEIEILSTPKGYSLTDIHQSRIGLRCTPRGLGSLKDGVVQEDYTISAIDVVDE